MLRITKPLSLIACIVTVAALFTCRAYYSEIFGNNNLKVTTWDAFGYYMYLPGSIIYHDVTQLKWLDSIEAKYQLTGGKLYQAHVYKNGNYVFKYLGGVAILQLPFFLAGHQAAIAMGYPADGFSAPYQYAIAFGIVLLVSLSLFVLHKILLEYFSDLTTALTIVLLILASNAIQYISVDSAMSHAPIFALYVFVIYTTIKWHKQPALWWAAATGYIIGLATISRPTEAIMLFIPLMWNTHTKEAAKQKWEMVKQHQSHVAVAAVFGFLGVLPQLIYWKIASGSFVYDVGSKWSFLNPFWRVLIGWEKGWFIYTPVTIFFVAGFFYLKNYAFRKSVLWFCLLNIYIIISWFDWRYGGTYSTRALVQSYPVFALPLAAFIEFARDTKWRFAFYLLAVYLLAVNLFQIYQYNLEIIHSDHMNRKYYGRVYLNTHPTPFDFSLLDTDEWAGDETRYQQDDLYGTDSLQSIEANWDKTAVLTEQNVRHKGNDWLRVEATIKPEENLWGAYLVAEVPSADTIKKVQARLFRPLAKTGNDVTYGFYVKLHEGRKESPVRVSIQSNFGFKGQLKHLRVTHLSRKD